MIKNSAPLGLAGLLIVSSGCSVLKRIDHRLTHFADALARREQRREESRPEFLLRKQEYFLHQGTISVPPVQLSPVTDIIQYVAFSYTSPEVLDNLYLTLSREFHDFLGDPYYEERQRVYPMGFSAVTNIDESVTYSYTFTPEMLKEKGRYSYRWWKGVPPEADPNIFESIADIFMRDDAPLLLEGVYERK